MPAFCSEVKNVAKIRKGRGSSLFRKYFFITMGILLASFVFAGTALMIFVSGQWMKEKINLLEENTMSITKNTSDVLLSEYMGQSGRGAVLMIYNSIAQASDVLDGDFFIVNEEGTVVYCKELLRNTGMMQDGKCLLHGNYQIPENFLETLSEGKTIKLNGTLEGLLAKENFVVGCPIITNDTFRGAVFGTIPIADGLLPYIAGIFQMFFFATLFAFVLTFILVYLTTYTLVKPLRQMSIAAKQYAQGDFSNRVYVKHSVFTRRSRTEVDELAEAFNTMAKELSALEYSRRSFVSNVSHELKTPMTTISGFIDGILDGTIDEKDEKKYLSIVSEEVKRLSRLVTGMLNISKLEAGKMELNPVEFDISEMLFTTLLSFEQILERKNIDVRGLDSVTENKIRADKDMINQVIYNLTDNAVKFTPEGGYIEVASKSDAEKVIVKIRNSGKGIPEEEINQIFERFYKVDRSRSYDTKGAGMGLYIVKTLIELHGGEITARSQEGEYTEFIFSLPK